MSRTATCAIPPRSASSARPKKAAADPPERPHDRSRTCSRSVKPIFASSILQPSQSTMNVRPLVAEVLPPASGASFRLHAVEPRAGLSSRWFVGGVRDRIGAAEDRFFASVFFGTGLLCTRRLSPTTATHCQCVRAVAHLLRAPPAYPPGHPVPPTRQQPLEWRRPGQLGASSITHTPLIMPAAGSASEIRSSRTPSSTRALIRSWQVPPACRRKPQRNYLEPMNGRRPRSE
jgi:hypothetical protein